MGGEQSQVHEPAIQEGSAKIYFPPDVKKEEVFYNQVQIFNRDLTCLVIKAYKELTNNEINIFEAFAATGLRSIRYAKEISGIKSIIANDIDPSAVSVIQENIKINRVDNIVTAGLGDAAIVLSSKRKEFQVIDLDPYSTAAPFIDGAVQAATDGGLLCVTSTDGRSLCGTQVDTGFAWYNSLPMNREFNHEFGIRILLTTIIAAASRHNRSIEPLLSLSANFYFRVFVRVTDKRQNSKITASTTSICFYSPDSSAFWLQPLGSLHTNKGNKNIKNGQLNIPYLTDPWTGCKLQIGGPIYTGPLHDKEFINQLLELLPTMTFITTTPRIKATLYTCQAEIDAPLYYYIDSMCGIVRSSCPPRAAYVSALRRLGYECSITHCEKGRLKTNAPPEVLWDFVRTWYFNEGKKLPPGDGVATKILSAPNTTEISLEIDEEVAQELHFEKKRCKFYDNPTKNFGPKSAAKKAK